MNTTDSAIGKPWLSSYLLCAAAVLMLTAIVAVTVWDFGWVPNEIPAIGQWLSSAFKIAYWGGLALIMLWFYRMTRYLQAITNSAFENGPFMAAFGFIIPILSLWKPYEAMLQIFKASRSPDDWKTAKEASIVGWWWAMWIIGNMAGIALRVVNSENSTASPEAQAYIVLTVRTLLIAKSGLLLWIVSQIMHWMKNPNKITEIEQVF